MAGYLRIAAALAFSCLPLAAHAQTAYYYTAPKTLHISDHP